MEINFKISKYEFKCFLKKNLKNTEIYKNPTAFYPFLVCIIVMILFRIISNYTAVNISIYIILILIIIFRKRLAYLRSINALNSLFKKYNFLFNDTKIIIGENGIKIIEEFEEKIFYWTGIHDFYVVDNYIFIRTLFYDDILIPFRSFKNKCEQENFITSIKQNTNLEPLYKFPKNYTLFSI